MEPEEEKKEAQNDPDRKDLISCYAWAIAAAIVILSLGLVFLAKMLFHI